MIKYLNYAITFQEVPNEVSLCFNITNCQNHCEDCHSPELRQDIGRNLERDLVDIVGRYQNEITCVCFLGDGNDYFSLTKCLQIIRMEFPQLKICLYSGNDYMHPRYYRWLEFGYLDYLKLGSYKKEYGPLNDPNTNQRMYKITHYDGWFGYDDITSEFWRKKV